MSPFLGHCFGTEICHWLVNCTWNQISLIWVQAHTRTLADLCCTHGILYRLNWSWYAWSLPFCSSIIINAVVIVIIYYYIVIINHVVCRCVEILITEQFRRYKEKMQNIQELEYAEALAVHQLKLRRQNTVFHLPTLTTTHYPIFYLLNGTQKLFIVNAAPEYLDGCSWCSAVAPHA